MATRVSAPPTLAAVIAATGALLAGCGETTGSIVPSSFGARDAYAQAQPLPVARPQSVPTRPQLPQSKPAAAPVSTPSSERPWSGQDGASGHPTMRASAIRSAAADFQNCLGRLYPLAAKRGVSRATFDRHVRPLTPDLRLMDLMDSQPEFTKAIWDYLDILVSEKRVAEGRAKLAQYSNVFERVERQYGVDRHILAAIWGVETSYGTITGDRSVLRSTATLACVGRRQSYFRDEFVATLEILHRNDVPAEHLKGSWAGAFGQTQFMPTTFRRFAVDFDGDRHRNTVDSVPDMLASTANKLRKDGWQSGESWGYEVTVPRGFDLSQAERSNRKSLGEWARLGVRRVGGQGFPRPGDSAFLLMPGGAQGPAFLMVHNFQVLMRYNPAEAYAIAIGHLADRLRGGGTFAQSWPRHERVLSRDERRELQELLNKRGLNTGGTSGRIGPMTRSAVRSFQRSVGLPADGFASATVLERLRR